MFKQNRNLLIIALIAAVNSLGYGIIIPVLYAYSMKYGLTDFQNGLLFSVFSICQFTATPLIGKMSDKYGRRPLLIISLAGTALSFFMMAFAPNAIFLFIARALDGITAGNIPVASAVISDTTTEKDRAKGFGIIGAAFGFGFIAGPAITAVTLRYGDHVPFVIAGVISLIAVILTSIFLPETNQHIGQTQKGKLFDFRKLIQAATYPNVGITLLMTLCHSVALSMFIYAFQPFSLKVLHLKPEQVSLIFVLFGVLGLIAQMVVLARITKMFGIKKAVMISLVFTALGFIGMSFSRSVGLFLVGSGIVGLFNSLVQPILQTMLSEETDAKSQGSILGVNMSYMSIGQIIGPIIGGALATYGIGYPLLAAGIMCMVCFLLAFEVMKPHIKRESLF